MTIATITATVAYVAPQYADDARLPYWVAAAIRAHTEANWGYVYDDAMANWVAHKLLRIDQETASGAIGTEGGPAPTGVSGTLTSRRAGDLSESFGHANIASAASAGLMEGESDYAQTPYGMNYLNLRRSRAATGPRILSVGCL